MLQGLSLALLGMSLVFVALALLAVATALLQRLTAHARTPVVVSDGGSAADPALTTERARVAAIVAGALMASALPLHLEPPVGPTFEHGRTAPIWVTAKRGQTLQPWQPPRVQDHDD
jgi:Na+-transporting methylmalonyl-CoA/oxaloacetate decarboxylase gamma subunit